MKPRVEFAMGNAVKFLVKFCCSSFLRQRSSKVPRTFHDKFRAIFTRRFAAANAQLTAFFTLQMFVLEIWGFSDLALPGSVWRGVLDLAVSDPEVCLLEIRALENQNSSTLRVTR